jgi:hypothetical protein
MTTASPTCHQRLPILESLIRLNRLADDLANQVRGDDLACVRATAFDLAARLNDVREWWLSAYPDAPGSRSDLLFAADLTAQIQNVVQSAKVGESAVTLTPALDYDLCIVKVAASSLLSDLRGTPNRGFSFWPLTFERFETDPPTPPSPAVQEDTRKSEEQAQRARVAPSAGRLLRASSWLLPPSDRVRYVREYESELWELASSGAGWIDQLLYAKRQALRAGQIRRVILSPRSRSASP